MSRPQFDTAMIFGIIIFVIVSLADSSDGETTPLRRGLEVFFTVLFASEALAKMYVFGFIRGPQAYFRSLWNMCDFILVSCRSALPCTCHIAPRE